MHRQLSFFRFYLFFFFAFFFAPVDTRIRFDGSEKKFKEEEMDFGNEKKMKKKNRKKTEIVNFYRNIQIVFKVKKILDNFFLIRYH